MIGDKKSMTKKQFKELQKKYRISFGMNPDTKIFQDKKHPTRAQRKRIKEVN